VLVRDGNERVNVIFTKNLRDEYKRNLAFTSVNEIIQDMRTLVPANLSLSSPLYELCCCARGVVSKGSSQRDLEACWFLIYD
jgi:DNA primase catalytic subunit